MKIAFYFTHPIKPDAGGTERVTHAIAEYLRNSGIDSVFISLQPGHDIESGSQQYYLPCSDMLICDENIRFVHNLIRQNNITVFINQDSFDAGNIFCSRQYFPEVKCVSVIHYNLYGSTKYVKDAITEKYLLGKTSSPKYILQRILTPYYRFKAYRNRTSLLKSIYDNADHIILLSEADKAEYPVSDKRRLHVITNPVTILPAPQRRIKEKRVLYVGRMVFAQKRVDYLLRAWKIIEAYHPDWYLDILGDGGCKDYYVSLADKLGLNNITFFGNRSPQDYYQRASILCLTSSFEGFGLVLTEGMQEGAVPVAFDSYKAIRDIIQHEVDGLLVRPFDIQSLANGILRLIEDENLRHRLSDCARNKVTKFGIENIGRQWIYFLQSIC